MRERWLLVLLLAAVAAAATESHQIETGRSMCAAARSQVDTLLPAVRSLAQQGDPEATLAYKDETLQVYLRWRRDPFHRTFPEQHYPTVVLDLQASGAATRRPAA